MLKLDEKTTIEADHAGWMLKTAYAAKPRKAGGKAVRHRISYHGTLRQALEAWVDDEAHRSGGTKADILAALNGCQRAIEEAVAQ